MTSLGLRSLQNRRRRTRATCASFGLRYGEGAHGNAAQVQTKRSAVAPCQAVTPSPIRHCALIGYGVEVESKPLSRWQAPLGVIRSRLSDGRVIGLGLREGHARGDELAALSRATRRPTGERLCWLPYCSRFALSQACSCWPPIGTDLSAATARAHFAAAHPLNHINFAWFRGTDQFGYSALSQYAAAAFGARVAGGLAAAFSRNATDDAVSPGRILVPDSHRRRPPRGRLLIYAPDAMKGRGLPSSCGPSPDRSRLTGRLVP